MAFTVIDFVDRGEPFGSDATPVAFDSDGCMNLQDNLNPPQDPIPFGDAKACFPCMFVIHGLRRVTCLICYGCMGREGQNSRIATR